MEKAEVDERGANYDREERTLCSTSSSEADTQQLDNKSKNNEEETDASYTKQQKFILLSTSIGNFFSFSCASLPAPFLPQLLSKTTLM
ncbi:hypothetical protein EB796_015424 [Bugula neritina]|uniref:Uncharacterized protein n=1 Tax=Bugula neritina TaxID=10212 RepID=A0A7J7JJ14_BUGNE|nr:hypothetical protein EB796_015424 [Bugula neritina]